MHCAEPTHTVRADAADILWSGKARGNGRPVVRGSHVHPRVSDLELPNEGLLQSPIRSVRCAAAELCRPGDILDVLQRVLGKREGRRDQRDDSDIYFQPDAQRQG